MHLALGSCWRDKHYLHVHAYRQEDCCCYTAVGEKKISCSKRNECDWNCPNAHTCPLGTSPVSPLEKKTGGGDDLLWICATKASMENRIWILLLGLWPFSLIHWCDLTGRGLETSYVNEMHGSCLLPSFPSLETTCPSTQPQAVTPTGMTHLGDPRANDQALEIQLFLAGSYCGLSCHKKSDWTGGWHYPELE